MKVVYLGCHGLKNSRIVGVWVITHIFCHDLDKDLENDLNLENNLENDLNPENNLENGHINDNDLEMTSN